MNSQRTDIALIKYLAQSIGPEAADVYNRLPLFLMPDESDELIKNERNLLDAAPENLPYPFDDFLLDFPFGMATLGKTLHIGDNPLAHRGRLWVRVRTFARAMRPDPATTIRRDQLDALAHFRPGLFLEGWEEKTGWSTGLPPYPDYSIISLDRDIYRDFKSYLHVYPNPLCKDKDRLFGNGIGWCNVARCNHPNTQSLLRCSGSEMMQATMCRLVILSLIYIAEGLGGITTEISWTPATQKEEKTERLKPWLSPKRQTYIIIDPARAYEYGHPSALTGDKKHHASPVPHARRGHWRRLSPDRKTWVRPAWVGATEWNHEGRTYKILL